jgi:hypothetical protein
MVRLLNDLSFLDGQDSLKNLVLEGNQLNGLSEVVPVFDPSLLVLKLIEHILV